MSPKPLLFLAAVVAALAAALAFGLDEAFSFATLQEHRDWLMNQVHSHGARAALVFILVYALAMAMPMPGGAVLTVTGGFLFGIVPGTVYSVIGATTGAVILFLAARHSFRDVLHRRASPWLRRFAAGFRANAVSYLLFLRLVPVFPFWLVNLVPAFLGVGLGTFTLTTLFGIIPGTLVYAALGNGLDALLARDREPGLDIVLQPDILLPLLGLGLLSLVPVLVRHLRRGQADAEDEAICLPEQDSHMRSL